jgi:formylglycine-generating enzyme
MGNRILIYMKNQTSSVPATIKVIIVLLLGLNVYLVSSMFVKSCRKAASDPAFQRQQESAQASRSVALTAPREALDEKVSGAAAASNTVDHFQTNALSGMRWIPGGKFMMGSPEGAGNADEHPQHAVIVDGFYMDTTEVTQAQYSQVMNANPSHFKGCPTCPVENVSWDDAIAYCGKVGKRLPTEAQWEYACRAGTTTMNYWGDGRDNAYSWHGKNSEQKTHPVGQKKSNSLGLYDMIGNVWEWCSDWYDSTDYGKSSLQNPQGPDSGTHRVFRGGSYASDDIALRCAARDWAVPDDRSPLFGFRCVHLKR